MIRKLTLGLALAAAPALAQEAGETGTAIFAGGCFWCVEADFDKIDGVLETTSGYTGGETENPTYKQVTYGDTGHYEAVRIDYDPSKVSYETLVNAFFRSVNPTDPGGQFCDRGDSYRTAIFALDEAQREVAEAAKAVAAAELEAKVVTPILDAGTFWPAEAYHQDYYEKNNLQYSYYRWSCGRDGRVEDLWGADARTSFKALNG
jgi:peptide-methionine (S)-S-oxide reductase